MSEPTLRDSIEAAIETVEPPESTLRAPEGSGGAGEAKPAADLKPQGSEPAPAAAAPAAPAGPTPAGEPKPGEPKSGEPKSGEPKPGEPKPGDQTQQPPAKELKAPTQWKPHVREHWNKLPREVQEEVLRREADNLRLVGSVGQKIKFADEVSSHLAPFAERLQSNGVAPHAFVADVFTTVKGLATGSMEEKAAIIANIVQSYGIDLRTLDAVLSSRVSAPPPSPEVLLAKQAAARAEAQLRQFQMQDQQQVVVRAQTTIEQFGLDPKNEFFHDVRDLMADLMESGQARTMDEAYQSAIWAHPDTRKILLQREAEQRAATRGQRAAAARQASSAVHGTPRHAGGNAPNPNASLRESLEQAFDDHSSL